MIVRPMEADRSKDGMHCLRANAGAMGDVAASTRAGRDRGDGGIPLQSGLQCHPANLKRLRTQTGFECVEIDPVSAGHDIGQGRDERVDFSLERCANRVRCFFLSAARSSSEEIVGTGSRSAICSLTSVKDSINSWKRR